MKKIFFIPFLAIMFFSCSESRTSSNAVNEDVPPVQTMDSLMEDTTKVLNVHLPVLIDSARQILVHEIHLSDLNSKDYSSTSKKGYGYSISLINLVFEDVINNKTVLLTNNQIKIASYRTLSKNFILYNLVESLSNNAKKNSPDIEHLYISNIDGTTFAKITGDKETLVQGHQMDFLNRYYFKTIEYTDPNDCLKGKAHYYYLEYNGQEHKVIEYDPMGMIK